LSGYTNGREVQVLGSIINERGDINEDINHCIRVGGKNERMHPEYYVIRKILVGLKGRVYHVVVEQLCYMEQSVGQSRKLKSRA